jgi:hypothetical protein
MYSTYLDIPVHQNFSLLRCWGRREVFTVHLEPLVNPPREATVEDGYLFVTHRLVKRSEGQAVQVERVGVGVKARMEGRWIGGGA